MAPIRLVGKGGWDPCYYWGRVGALLLSPVYLPLGITIHPPQHLNSL